MQVSIVFFVRVILALSLVLLLFSSKFLVNPKVLHFIFAILFLISSVYWFWKKEFLYQFFLKDTEIQKQRKLQWNFPIEIFIVITIYFSVLLYNHYYSFYLVDNDYISMSEVLNNISKGYWFKTNYHGDKDKADYLAHHFSLSLLFLVPFIKISELKIGYGIGLFFMSGISILGIYNILKEKWSILPILIFIYLYTTNAYTYRLFTSYHFEILFPVFLFLAYYFYKQNKEFLFFVFLLFGILVKEDIAIYIAIFSSYFLFEKRYSIFLLIFLFCLFYFLWLVPFIQSSLDQTARVVWLEEWSKYGNTKLEIIKYLITNPNIILSSFWNKRQVFWDFSTSFGFLFLLHWRLLPTILSIFAIHFLSGRMWHNELYNYYCYTIFPFLWIATMEVLDRYKNTKYFIPILLLVLSFSFYRNSKEQFFPLKGREIDWNRVENIKSAIQLIPTDSSVSCQFDLSSFIPNTKKVYPIDQKEWKEYVLMDLQKGFSPYIPLEELENYFKELIHSQKYKVIYSYNGVILLKKMNLK